MHSIIDEVMLFRSDLGSFTGADDIMLSSSSPALTSQVLEEDAIMEDAGTIGSSPMRAKRQLASSLASSPDAPLAPSLPPVKSDQVATNDDEKQGWAAQLMRFKDGTVEQVAAVQGGGQDEDALCIAPGSTGDREQVIAVELANSLKEMFLCSLTKNKFRVYRMPELNIKANASLTELDTKKEVRSIGLSNSSARVYKKDESASWWNQSEEEVFGDLPSTRALPNIEDEASLRKSERGVTASPLPIVENITNLIPEKSLGVHEGETSIPPGINESEANAVIDLSKARRCPCPPLCGVTIGRAGKLVSFTNGPVKKMYAWYRDSPGIKPTRSYNDKPVVFSEVTTTPIDAVENEKKAAEDHQTESGTPRTLFDLVEMQSAAKIAQWGEEIDNNSSNSDDGSPDNSSSGSSEDQSFGDSSDESDDSDGFCHVANKFDEYFASARKSLTHIDVEDAVTEVRDEHFAGITSLASSVLVTNEYDNLLLGGQTPQLAHMLELGQAWWLTKDFSTPTSWEHSEKRAHSDEAPVPPTPDNVYTTQISHSESSRSASMVGNLKKLFALQSPSASIPADQRLCKYLAQHNSLYTDQLFNSHYNFHSQDQKTTGFSHPRHASTPSSIICGQ